MEIQNIMEALDLGVLFNEMDKLVNNFESSSSDEDNLDESPMRQTYCSLDPNKPSKSRDWIKEIIANDQTDSEDSDFEDIQFYLRFHQTCNKYADETKIDPDLFKYMHYSTDIVTGESKYKNNQTELRKPKAKSKKGFSAIKEEPGVDEDLLDGDRRSFYKSGISDKRKLGSSKKANVDTIRKRLWKSIAKKDIPKAYRQKSQNRAIKGMLLKKLIKEACKRLRVKAIESRQKCRSEAIVSRARRMTREAQVFWKKYSKVEKSQRKRAEKQALVQRKLDEEIREAQRQRRKLNYLITQTELYAHFMCGKLKKTLTDEATKDESDILNQLDEPQFGSNDEYTKESALENAQAAYEVHQQSTNEFIADKDLTDFTNFQQPTKLVGKLTGYQLTGVNWLAGLYAHGLNGILADDMGLGKTIQTIAFLAHLSERIGIWGPFLVVAPASTLNNWHQEFARFLPSFKVLPYWGNVNERKILRLFWNQKESSSGTTSAPFHVLVTSYQLVISDVRYFQRIKWQYMVLDEAHALKSTSSIRWKTLLDFNCRNRLLLTGTPIQNTMAELWALLHFIMPTLFDNHGEFNEWFSKDIEYHAENKSNIDEKHLSRLHMILKPFMLRRLKSEVEHELTDKIEVRVMCQLAPRQRRLYDSLQKNITLQELLKKTTSVVPSNASGNVLMNLVMQFRKMCNHPDLFDSHDVHSSFLLSAATYRLPALLYHEIFTDLLSPSRRKILYSDFSVHSPSHVHRSLTSIDGEEQSCFSFMRLMDLSVAEYAMNFTKSATTRFDHCRETRRKTKARLRAHFWGLDAPEKFTDTFPHFVSNQLSSNKKQPLCEANREPTINGGLTLLLPTFVDRFKAASSRSVFSSFVFCRRRYEPFFFAHVNCDVTSLSQSDRSGGPPATGKRRNTGAQELVINLKNQSLDDMFQQRVVADQLTCQPLSVPKLIKDVAKAKVYCYVPEIYCNERSAAHKLQQANSLMRGNCFENFNPISIPDRERLVSDSGKLLALDMLLRRLKDGGHRVLIYSQMTKMIDLLEEYMVLRRHTYVRLDGSSRISSRRDTVAGFQARNDIFVFLLSTRAGGLGINLTAADTVIFFDSDWNPTVDQQAMDRAHRLGQTKQVTVYRLVCQGTVDERVLQRAEEKSAIQNMVISGGSFKADSLKPKEVVSLLLDDQQMAREFNEMGDTPGRKFVIGGRRGKKRGRKSNREKEMERAKRLRELEGGSTSPAPEPSAFLGPAASTVMRMSGSGQPSREASPSPSSFADSNTPSELSCDGDSRGAEDEPLIVVDELPPFDSPPAPDVRRGRRGRGRPRIRPLVPRKSHFMTRTTTSRSRASRSRGGRRAGRKAFSGRAAAMAGARAGMAAASAAAFAAYGYNLPNSSGGS